MYAQQLTSASGPSGVQLAEIDEPDGTGRVVVDLHAAGVAFPDLLQTTGSYQIVRDLPFVLGLEGAGVVRSTTVIVPNSREVRVIACKGTGATTINENTASTTTALITQNSSALFCAFSWLKI